MQSKMMGPYRIYSDRHIRVGRRERPHPITGVPLVAQPVDIVGPLYHQGQALLILHFNYRQTRSCASASLHQLSKGVAATLICLIASQCRRIDADARVREIKYVEETLR